MDDGDCSSCPLRFESAAILDHLVLVYLEYGGIKPSANCSFMQVSDHAKNITIKSTFDIGENDEARIDDLRLFFIVRSVSSPRNRPGFPFLTFIDCLTFLLNEFSFLS